MEGALMILRHMALDEGALTILRHMALHGGSPNDFMAYDCRWREP